MSTINLRNSLEWALMVAFILSGSAIAQAQKEPAASSEDQQPQGKIVQIGPTGDGPVAVDDQKIEQPVQPELPKYWIGILGGPVSDELRAQIDVPAGTGILVQHVAPDSPAAKAGLQVFDILLRANDNELEDVADLSTHVRIQGANGGTIALDVLRRGQHETIKLTPEARPDAAAAVEPDVLPGQGWGSGGMIRGGSPAMPFFDHSGQPLQFRMFGPGTVISHQGFGLSQMPNGVSVSIQKQNDEPAHITVKRGNDTWDIVGDEPSSLAQLPDDVRPFVEQLLAGGGPMQMPLPAMPNMPFLPTPPGIPDAPRDDALQQRLQKMEQQLQTMQLMLEHGIETPHVDDHAKTEAE
ncbi:MAG: PDZ domain-containing protein [Pirellulales bacterium]